MKKSYARHMARILGAGLIACAAMAGTAACAGDTKWDVSADGSKTVTAELTGDKGAYTLNIRGNGQMKDFSSPSDAPWHSAAKDIEKINISYGVSSIGANAFAEIGADNVVLPSSVISAGENFVSADTKIFAVNDDVDYREATPDNVYTYREQPIETNDRYWQSDKSKGDIVENGEDLSGGKGMYWRYDADDEAVVYQKIKVLFIGNSFTYRNGVVEFSSGVPGIFDNIAEDLGYATETYSITGPGWYLESHANANDTCGRQVDKLLKACSDFDYIVLQDQSTVAFENYERFIGGIKALQQKIEDTQDDAEIFLYETWGSPFSANERNITVPEMEAKLREAYTRAGEECGLNVSYIGKAFTDVYNHHRDTINLYASDNRHQGYPGAYLSAGVHVGNMLGGDVRQTGFVGEAEYDAPELDRDTLDILRTAAYNAVFGESDEGDVEAPPVDTPEEDGEQKEILKIACWGRFMKEAKFRKLIEDFKAYCADNNVEYKEIVATYYEGSTTGMPYYYIADFTAKVYADGDPDIVLPCADNFNANQSTLAAIKMTEINVYGQTGRRVAAINDDELTMEFFNYIATQSAKDILAEQD